MLLGIICLGLVGVSGTFYFLRVQRAQGQVAVAPSAVVIFTATPIPPTATLKATNTSEPTSTGTPVIVEGPTSVGQVITKIVVAATSTSTSNSTPSQMITPTIQMTVTPTKQTIITPTNTTTATLATKITGNVTPTSTALAVVPLKVMPEGGGILLPNGENLLVGAGVATLLLIILGLFNHLRRSL